MLSGGEISFVMAVYGQPLMLEKWWETLRSYDDGVLDKVHLVIVDDHGDPAVEVPDDIRAMLDVRVYRVDDNIPWNQMGARNLGMKGAVTNWCLMLDPDMVVEPAVAKRLLQWPKRLSRGQLVKLGLRYTNDVLDNSSPNVYFLHKEDFKRAGGYDEDYAGHKGWSDVQFLHTLTGLKFRFVRAGDLWVRYYRPADIADATVKTLNRSVQHNRRMHINKMGRAKQGWVKWAAANWPKTIRFKWSRVH